MERDGVLQKLEAFIEAESTALLGAYAQSGRPRQMAVFELVRSLDLSLYCRLFVKDNPVLARNTHNIVSFGQAQAMNLFMDESCNNPGVPLFASDDASAKWADTVMWMAGCLGQCKRLIEFCRTGLGEMSLVGANEFHFEFASGHPMGLEQHDLRETSLLREILYKERESQFKKLAEEREAIERSLLERVDVWRDHYIRYESTPEIDKYFEMGTQLASDLMAGKDSFARHIKIGGVPFGVYADFGTAMVERAEKHLAFCAALGKKASVTNPRNLFTTVAPLEKIVSPLGQLIGASRDETICAAKSFALTLENKHHHRHPDSGMPTYVQIGDEQYAWPLWAITNPFPFMVRELKRRFPADWDRAVDSREAEFRMDLAAMFMLSDVLVLSREKVIKEGKQVRTDIDAAVFEPKSGILGLFQLKWQDPFGSMHERSSRKKNLLEANDWVETVSTWLAGKSMGEVGRFFELPKLHADGVERIVLFVISRNAAHFSGPGVYDDRAAWGTWHCFVRLGKTASPERGLLEQLDEGLRSESPLKKPSFVPEAEEIRLPRFRVICSPGKI